MTADAPVPTDVPSAQPAAAQPAPPPGRVRGYVEILTTPGLARMLLPYLVGRLGSAMGLLALLLAVRAGTGSFAVAGSVSAGYGIGLACVAPLLGRIADRRSASVVLFVTGLVMPLGLVGTAIGAEHGWPAALLVACAALSGSCAPPFGPCLRALWPIIAPDPDRRRIALTLESVLLETTFIVAPAIVGGLTALSSARSAVVAAACATAIGALSLAAATPMRQRARTGDVDRHWLGPLRAPSVLILLLIVSVFSVSLGAMEVAVAAFATVHRSPAAAGTLLALWALGSTLGGLWYGTARLTRTPRDMLSLLILAVVAGMALVPLARSMWLLGLILAVGSLPITPAMTTIVSLMTDAAPEGTRTETFTWLSAANWLGLSGGAVLAGILVTRVGTATALWTVVAAMGVAGVLSVAGRQLLPIRLSDD